MTSSFAAKVVGFQKGSGAGNGFASASFSMNLDPTAIGLRVFAQWVLLDPGTPTGLSASQAAEIIFF